MNREAVTRTERKVENNAKYQRGIEKSFAVIYHNLKRIQEDGNSSRNNLRHRRHSQTVLPTAGPAKLNRHKSNSLKERSVCAGNQLSNYTRKAKKRVHFCDHVRDWEKDGVWNAVSQHTPWLLVFDSHFRLKVLWPTGSASSTAERHSNANGFVLHIILIYKVNNDIFTININ